MTVIEIISLSTIMMVLAALPSASVLLVLTRSATLGVGHGIAVAGGIVLGDLVFILLVVSGLYAIAETMSGLFIAIKYLGGCYLFWMGVELLRSSNPNSVPIAKPAGKSGLLTSFMAGLLLTLGDIKALILYVSLFPLFLDITAMGITDIAMIVLVMIVTVGGVKIAYALMANNVIARLQQRKLENLARKTVGGVMIGAGGYLIAKS